MACEFRPWTLQDLESIRSVTWSTWVDAYSAFVPVSDLQAYFSEHYSLRDLEILLRDPLVRGFVADVDGAIVGYLKTKFAPEEGRLYVSSVYVLPEVQRKGYGGRLMTLAEGEARHRGVGEIWLGVMTQNVRALDWYLRHGFEFVEELPFTMGRTTVPHRIGRKRIDAVRSEGKSG
jgi:ribosomal protein S18 acetylase RimI-like enzyme